MVRPPYWVSTSPGRSALPPIAFSAAGTSPVTRNGQPIRPSAASTAITTAPPVMSRFMVDMASPGLIDRPPLSKVMPLPTRTTRGALRAPRGGV